MSKKRFLTSFLLLTVIFAGGKKTLGQTYPDAGLWATFNIEHKLEKGFTLLFTEEFRLRENFTQLNLFYTNLGAAYRLSKLFRTALVYRAIQKYRPEDVFSYRHRLMWDVSAKGKVGKIDISARHRLQAEVRNIYSSDKGRLPEWYSRMKLQVQYDWEKSWKPYFATEWRYQYHDPRNTDSDYLLHRARFMLGVDYKPGPRQTLGAYYLIQTEFNIPDPEYLYIAGLEYSLDL